MERQRLGKWLLVIACVCALGAPARATNLCGTTVIDDVKLAADVLCTGDGLIVGTSGIRIDLNGFTIRGSGGGIGVTVSGRTNVTITGGTIRQFAFGVRVNDSTDLVVSRMEFTGNTEGIDFQSGSINNTVKDNTFRQHSVRAIMLRGNTIANDIKANTFSGNRVGILVFAGADTSIKNNFISGSSLAGIRVNGFATGNVFKDNIITANAAGVEFFTTTTTFAVGNELKGNSVSSNGCGLKGPLAGNDVHDNSFDSNTADTCS